MSRHSPRCRFCFRFLRRKPEEWEEELAESSGHWARIAIPFVRCRSCGLWQPCR